MDWKGNSNLSSPNVMASKEPGAHNSWQLTERKKSEKNRYGTSNGPEGRSQNDVCRSHPTHAETNNEMDMA